MVMGFNDIYKRVHPLREFREIKRGAQEPKRDGVDQRWVTEPSVRRWLTPWVRLITGFDSSGSTRRSVSRPHPAHMESNLELDSKRSTSRPPSNWTSSSDASSCTVDSLTVWLAPSPFGGVAASRMLSPVTMTSDTRCTNQQSRNEVALWNGLAD